MCDISFIDTVRIDFRSRFENMNEQSSKIGIFYRLLDLFVAEIKTGSTALASIYHDNSIQLENEINTARVVAKTSSQTFKTFQDSASFLLNKLPITEFPLLHKYLSIVLVLPFSTADCERAFSVMNEIKTKKCNRPGDILRALMTINCANENELKALDYNSRAYQVSYMTK